MKKQYPDLLNDNVSRLFRKYLVPSISATLVTSIYILADTVMIGRGAQGNPWIFSQALHVMAAGEKTQKPSAEDVVAMVLKHAKMQIDFKGEYLGIREMRKHTAWYLAGYPNSAKLRKQVNQVESYSELETLLHLYIENKL